MTELNTIPKVVDLSHYDDLQDIEKVKAAGIIVVVTPTGSVRVGTLNEAACLGFCPPAAIIVPRVMDFALQVEPPPVDRAAAKKLLAEAGHPNGLDGGDFFATPGFPTLADAVVSDLAAVGIRVRMRQTEQIGRAHV